MSVELGKNRSFHDSSADGNFVSSLDATVCKKIQNSINITVFTDVTKLNITF